VAVWLLRLHNETLYEGGASCHQPAGFRKTPFASVSSSGKRLARKTSTRYAAEEAGGLLQLDTMAVPVRSEDTDDLADLSPHDTYGFLQIGVVGDYGRSFKAVAVGVVHKVGLQEDS
jgi:hypothetical protein